MHSQNTPYDQIHLGDTAEQALACTELKVSARAYTGEKLQDREAEPGIAGKAMDNAALHVARLNER